jgi:hypothetical protein
MEEWPVRGLEPAAFLGITTTSFDLLGRVF